VALNDNREANIVFDSDIGTNRHVHRAAERLTKLLAQRGAEVSPIYLPPADGGRKQGVDDFIAALRDRGITAYDRVQRELAACREDDLRPPPPRPAAGSGQRPEIQLTASLPEVAELSWRALQAVNARDTRRFRFSNS